MMRYELELFMKLFHDEIEILIELDDGKELSTGIAEAKYYMARNGTGYVQLIPSSILTRKVTGYTRTKLNGQMEEVNITVKTKSACSILKRLVDFIEKHNVKDKGSNDGYFIETWRSDEFEQLIEKAKEVIKC